jgi:hypothetical protein
VGKIFNFGAGFLIVLDIRFRFDDEMNDKILVDLHGLFSVCVNLTKDQCPANAVCSIIQGQTVQLRPDQTRPDQTISKLLFKYFERTITFVQREFFSVARAYNQIL